MTPAECRSALGHVLDQSIARAKELKEILDTERAALVAADADDLSGTAVAKRDCVIAIEELERRREDIVSRAGFDPGADDMPALISWCGSTELSSAWHRYLDVAKDCSEMNASNGAIINMRRSQIQSTLSLMRNGHAEGDVYGPDGGGSDSLGSRSLTEA